MIELPDDELDKLFRKSSEELDPNFEPEDWNALRKRLDREDGKTPAAWLRKWWPLGALALLIPAGLTGYYLFNNSGSDNQVDPEIVVSEHVPAALVKPEKSTEPKLADGVKNEGNTTLQSEKTQDNVTGTENSPATENRVENTKIENQKSAAEATENIVSKNTEISKALPRSRSKSGGVYLDPNHSKGKKGDGAFSSAKNQLSVREKLVNKIDHNIKVNPEFKPSEQIDLNEKTAVKSQNPDYRNSIADGNLIQNETTEPGNANITSEQEDRLFLSASSLDHLAFNNKANLTLPAIEKVEPVSETPVLQQSKQEEPSPKLAIRVGYSPDLSTVGLKNFTKPGSSFSLLIEYGLVPRLYVQTGIVRSAKDYTANAGEYKLMPYVTNINTPYDVDGACNMFEIPLGFRYDVIQTQHSRWFAGTGFTSYYVQKEKYVYHYATYVHGQKSGWEGKTGWFWLSHINASVGYERSISKKLSILAEPFIRIPVKGVGYGKVNLITTGMWLSLRYTPYFFNK